MTPMFAGPLKQPVPESIMCVRCESKCKQRGGYLMGGWSDFINFVCTGCGHIWYWQPDKPEDT